MCFLFSSVSPSTKCSQKSTCIKIKNTSCRTGNGSKVSRNCGPSCCSHAPIYSCSSQALEATHNFRPDCWPFCFYRRAFVAVEWFCGPVEWILILWGPTAFTHFTGHPGEQLRLAIYRLPVGICWA